MALPKKPRKCPECNQPYIATWQRQVCCDKDECRLAYAIRIGEKSRQKRIAKAAKAERIAGIADRKVIKIKKEQIKRRPELIKEAQQAVNAVRRTEELMKGSGCISCDRTQAEVLATDGWKPGGAWDAGHFMSVGSRPAKRFLHANIWLQCKSCNAGSGKYAKKANTVSKAFRANLVDLIGLDAVEELERDNGEGKWTADELRRIRDEHKQKLKSLKGSL